MDLNEVFEHTPEKENVEIPSCILDGINEKFVLREYQEEAIKRFIYYLQNISIMIIKFFKVALLKAFSYFLHQTVVKI